MVMTAGGMPKPSPKTDVTDSAPPLRAKSRKRVRVSELTRKYRSDAGTKDEAQLVGDTSSSNYPSPEDLVTANSIKEHNDRAASTASSLESQSPDITASDSIASAAVAAAVAAAATSSPVTGYQAPVRFSRFPGSWSEAVTQARTAVSSAVMEGHDRIRVDLKTPELLADTDLRTRVYNSEKSTNVRRIELLVESANSILRGIFNPRVGAQNPYNFLFTPTRAAIFFNSEEDEKVGKPLVSRAIPTVVDTYVLGRDSEAKIKANVSLVIAPSNKQGNPNHIEEVELVHYANWNTPKLVIMLNPDLFALTRYPGFNNEPRQPCFMSDYVSSYYMDPAAFPSKTATGAVLRCFPRKWEMYLLKMQSDMGFRLVAEHMSPPSPERIHCEFSWRIERELGSGLTA